MRPPHEKPKPDRSGLSWIIGALVLAIALMVANTGSFIQLERYFDIALRQLAPDPQALPAANSGAKNAEMQPEAAAFEPLSSHDFRPALLRAMAALSAGRFDEAGRLYREMLAALERDRGEISPMAALLHSQLAFVGAGQKNFAEEERELLRALAILERYSDKEIRQTRAIEGALDQEMLAARLGYHYWEQRRYDKAYQYYERAYDAAPRLDTSEESRNRRLAVSSAGLMASACTLGKWDIADRAMAELKLRMVNVDAELREWLRYWVRTGEPRLAARRC